MTKNPPPATWFTHRSFRRIVTILLTVVCPVVSCCAAPTPQFGLRQNADIVAAARRLQKTGRHRWRFHDARCLADFHEAIHLLWPTIGCGRHTCPHESAELAFYNSAVHDLLVAAQELQCFDPRHGISVPQAGGGQVFVPVQYQGMTWMPHEYCRFKPVRHYLTTMNKKSCCGVGVALLGFHKSCRRFVDPSMPFAATAVIAPNAADGTMTLFIVNTIEHRAFQYQSSGDLTPCQLPLARDTTAPLAYLKRGNPNEWIQGLLNPGSLEGKAGLYMMQPHQPGKIPVVVVHGLASTPTTWVTLVNELLADPAIQHRFEIWAFFYPTGTPFPLEAAKLRQQLREVRSYADPQHEDPTLDRTVLIGHSMGGLLSKLQVTESGNRVAQSVDLTPAEIAAAPPEIKNALYWTPVRSVERVIYMATPHRGTDVGNNPLRLLASRLVRFDGTPMAALNDFTVGTRSQLTERRHNLPTSFDMLKPGNPTLQATVSLPVSCRVKTHSIVGYGHNLPFHAPGDGHVALSSSRIRGVQSELLVESDHWVHRRPAAINEVRRILLQHAYSESSTPDSTLEVPPVVPMELNTHLPANAEPVLE